jgi:hypothetical protein
LTEKLYDFGILNRWIETCLPSGRPAKGVQIFIGITAPVKNIKAMAAVLSVLSWVLLLSKWRAALLDIT